MIIQQDLDRKQQRKLVGTLVELCQENKVDPDDLETLVSNLKTGLNSQFHRSLVTFFKNPSSDAGINSFRNVISNLKLLILKTRNSF